MEVLHPRCAGIDVGKKSVMVCVRVAGAGRRKSAVLAREEFARWAKYEVVLQENEWVRVEEGSRVTANSNTA